MKGHAATQQEIGVIHQEDGVIDHNPAQHDASDKRLNVECRMGEKEHQNDPDSGKGDREHHHERVKKRFVQRGHDHIDHDQGQNDAQEQLAVRLLLFRVVCAEGDGKVSRHGNGLQSSLDVVDNRTQVAAGNVG